MSAIQPDYSLLIVGGKTGLCDEPGYQWPGSPDHYERVLVYRADVVDMLQAECERLRSEVAAGDMAFHEEADTVSRLRAELAAAQKDKRELLEQLRFIRAHLYAATVQRSPTDDQIIADHIEQAYRRANEVIKDAEKRDE